MYNNSDTVKQQPITLKLIMYFESNDSHQHCQITFCQYEASLEQGETN
jgi:hypothetical protein